ncbi:MAG: glycosyltransferase family 2 protein [Flavobacteriales bacterium]
MLSICIPAYNCNVDALVGELQNQASSISVDVEIVVGDDCSPIPVLSNSSSFHKVQVIRNSKNLGRSTTRNLLAKAARFPVMLFLDGDSEVISASFLANWIALAESDSVHVSYGGSLYQLDPPSNHQMLRWKVSTIRESQLLNVRKQSVGGFKTNNVLIRKSVFERVVFNEKLAGYGHEDTLFGFELLVNGYTVHQIDNPVRNALLDTNEAYLAKTEEAIQNLVACIRLSSNREAFIAHVRLLRGYAKMRKSLVIPLLRAMALFGLPLLRKRLLAGRSVGLVYLFDCFKLVMLDRTLKEHHIKV